MGDFSVPFCFKLRQNVIDTPPHFFREGPRSSLNKAKMCTSNSRYFSELRLGKPKPLAPQSQLFILIHFVLLALFLFVTM